MSFCTIAARLPTVIETIVSFAPPGFQTVGASTALPDDEKIEILKDADFLMLNGQGRVSDACLRAAETLRLHQLLGAGYDKENLSLLDELGIPLANMPGELLQAVAELTIGMMLALNRRLI